MARSDHATYTAADRYERRANRRPKPTLTRRTGTRRALVAAAVREG